jgi:hypothetical protein
MVPKLAKKGASFRGAAVYYLHDKEASTTERVAWVETRNLATHDPEIAWRVMAATALDQERLKAQAGVKSTGRKSANSVMAYSLAWHPDEKATLTREEMLRAVDESLEALGATKHQALVICHSDEPHPHVHILLNRVSPEDGRMLSSSNEKLNLSRWAQAYEEKRGKIWCEERVANNHTREQLQEYTRGEKDTPRHIFEEEQKAERAIRRNAERAKALKAEQRDKDAALSRRGREMHGQHRRQWDALSEAHQGRKKAIDQATEEAINRTRHNIRERDREAWRAMFKRHFAEKRTFDEREAKLSGKLQNAIEAIRSMSVVRGDADGRGRVGEAFNYLASRSKRYAQLERKQAGEVKAFVAAQRKEIAAGIAEARADRRDLLKSNLERFYRERQDLMLKQSMDQAALRAAWRQRNEDRKDAWKKFRLREIAFRDANSAFSGDRERQRERER